MSATERRRPAAAAQPAFVLHSYDWSESSLILDLLTQDEGRQVVAAKGAKRPYSQLRPVLLPFQRVLVQLSRSKGEAEPDEVRTLRSAEWAGGAAILPASRLLSGFYLNELLMKFLPRGQAQPFVFECYAQTLRSLAQAGGGAVSVEGAALRAFELLLLQHLGLLPDLSVETIGGNELDASAVYVLKPEMGLVGSTGSREPGLDGASWIGLQAALMSGHLEALQAACLAHPVALRATLRAVLAYHLDGARLRTRDLIHELRRFDPPGGSATPVDGIPR